MTPHPRAGPGQDESLVIIFNRRALAARALRRVGLEQALRERSLTYHIVEADSGTEAAAASKRAARSGYLVVAAGGDGTARAVGNGILESGRSEAVMAHLPLGTGNDLARALGRVGFGLEQALDALIEMNVRSIDVLQVNGGECCLNSMGVGFDAAVAQRRLDQQVKLPSYFPDAIRTMLHYRPQRYRVSWPDGELEGPALMAAAMNGNCEGGGVRLAPKANIADGLVDIYWIDPISFWQFARYVWAVRWGRHGRLKVVRHWTTSRLTIESPTRLQYHLDGEYREMTGGGKLEIAVLPRRLRVVI
ncbi:MAG: diacylglycerol kinase family lipid kinase [Gemmatimonadetes bacterium]|uniref:Diacylglycerol kinase family lipid kinase n=1 Tax=Candidatus Kutchimonas denitrificans TaxID=3056748 RepID=A0AAE4ZD05_9BACT|nr:diacylglycerol kinase family lipid kinase [Gemmatimonadota bacterium]NIR75730.1 diacylglycerol kinase family lipid kinase [Candidatus Kutchimonas denitrificans]NIS00343.1 diacylglycerol kinase family lipid kinase [Gemmatimonadota bacterium]NIT66002.1 diacylglycerol kinase family lipid kinase [Gemmatimonadota bacterium]NIU53706.1 YegS/Rv2252/BmrU family lipid kinase [Gemmatimonadota bacterium]